QVLNPNPDHYIVENGSLLIVNSKVSSLAEDSVENLFKLASPMPEGDWIASMRLTIDFQTGWERVFIGLHDSKDSFIVTEVSGAKCTRSPNDYFCLVVRSSKNTAGDSSYFEQSPWWGEQRVSILKVKDFPFAQLAKELPQPLVLRLRKQGRSYIGEVVLGDAVETKFEMEKLTSLRPPGDLVIGVRQEKQVQRETAVTVDWVKIESLR
ncbi:MAG: hypothetical protein ACRD2A_18440, partial [Vicinamibacterales bacterium]